MSVINTQSLYDSFFRRFSIGTNSASRFQAAFLSSYNDVLMDLFNEGNVDEPTLLTALSEDSLIEERFLPQIKIGLKAFLQTDGEWVKGDDRDDYAQHKWNQAMGVFENVKTALSQDAETYYSPWGEA